ncbi:hypothetical protein ACWCPJ_17055 [Streptomyces collinus]
MGEVHRQSPPPGGQDIQAHEPCPGDDPVAAVAAGESVRLAFVAALP